MGIREDGEQEPRQGKKQKTSPQRVPSGGGNQSERSMGLNEQKKTMEIADWGGGKQGVFPVKAETKRPFFIEMQRGGLTRRSEEKHHQRSDKKPKRHLTKEWRDKEEQKHKPEDGQNVEGETHSMSTVRGRGGPALPFRGKV